LLQVVQTLELRSVNDAGQGLDDLDWAVHTAIDDSLLKERV
jgi:hypothetical protein